jgi:2-octaprenyl-6-methoxyphenol hydroxylase
VKTVDVAIVGGGIVGCVLAKGLSEQAGLNVTLIDASDPHANETINPLQDKRVIALAKRTVDELTALGVPLKELAKQHPGTIEHIEVSDKGHAGLTDLHCNDYGLSSFGQVVSLGALTTLVVKSQQHYTHLSGVTVRKVTRHKQHASLSLSNDDVIDAKLLVVADGGHSPITEWVGISRQTKSYNQTALIFNVHTQQRHTNRAYERFTSQGPLAFLPFDNEIEGVTSKGNGFSVVWTLAHDEAQRIAQQPAKACIPLLQETFGYRAGRITHISDMASYPLQLRTCDTVTSHRVVVVGNAAQALHPIAGQGFNLGMRDIASLVEVLKGESDPGAFSCTQRYENVRKHDRVATIGLTDRLVHTFSNQHFPLVVGRNLSLLALNAFSQAKQAFVRQATGFAKHQTSGH